MKKKDKGLIFVVIIVLILVLCFLFYSMFAKEKDEGSADSVIETSSSVNTEEASSGSDGASSVPDYNGDEFVEIQYRDPPEKSMVGRAPMEKFGPATAQAYMESYDFKRVIASDGFEVYEPTGHNIYKDKNGYQYIVAGPVPTKIIDGKIISTQFVRDENTFKRIRVFPSETEKTAFDAMRKMGKEVLDGKPCKKNSILVDGCLSPYFFKEEDGTIYVNIADVSAFGGFSNGVEYNSEILYVRANDVSSVPIPTEFAGKGTKQTFDVSELNGTFVFRNWAGEEFERRFKLLDQNNPYMDIQDMCSMLGWRVYRKGDVIHIVTDPLNITDDSLVIESEIRYKYTLGIDENGNTVVRKYDSNGVVVETRIIGETNTHPENALESDSVNEEGDLPSSVEMPPEDEIGGSESA